MDLGPQPPVWLYRKHLPRAHSTVTAKPWDPTSLKEWSPFLGGQGRHPRRNQGNPTQHEIKSPRCPVASIWLGASHWQREEEAGARRALML